MARGSRGPKALRKAVLSVLYSRIFFCTTRLMHGWHESTQTSLGAGMRMTGWYIVERKLKPQPSRRSLQLGSPNAILKCIPTKPRLSTAKTRNAKANIRIRGLTSSDIALDQRLVVAQVDAEVDQGAKSSQTHTCGADGYSSGDQPNPSRLVELLWSLYPVSFATDMALRQRHIGCVGHTKVQALQGCEDTGWPID